MNKEYFKILKEINSLESKIIESQGLVQAETNRVDKLIAKESRARDERRELESALKEAQTAARQNENLIASFDSRIKKLKADIAGSFEAKEMELLEKEKAKVASNLEHEETLGLELLDKIESLQGALAEKETFLSGISETIEEIQNEVNVIAGEETARSNILKNRISLLQNQLTPQFKSAYERAKSKNLSTTIFSSIAAGKCSICKMNVDKEKASQVEDQLALKTCSACGRIFIPNQALY